MISSIQSIYIGFVNLYSSSLDLFLYRFYCLLGLIQKLHTERSMAVLSNEKAKVCLS
jgi:hypothetical protein